MSTHNNQDTQEKYYYMPSWQIINMAKGKSTLNVQWAFIEYFGDILPAVMLGFFCDQFSIYAPTEERESLLRDGGFYCSNEKIESKIRFKKDRTQRVIKILEKRGFLEIRMIKVTATAQRYVFLNWEKIESVMLGKKNSSTPECGFPAAPDEGKPQDYLIKQNQYNNNKNSIHGDATSTTSSRAENPSKSFVIPKEVDTVLEHWNAHKDFPKCRGTEGQCKDIAKAIKKKGLDNILIAMSNYREVMSLPRTWWTYQYNLIQFIKQQNAWDRFGPENYFIEQYVEKSKSQKLMESVEKRNPFM